MSNTTTPSNGTLDAFLATAYDLRWWLTALAFLLIVLAYVDLAHLKRQADAENRRLRERVRRLEENERISRMSAGRPGWDGAGPEVRHG